MLLTAGTAATSVITAAAGAARAPDAPTAFAAIARRAPDASPAYAASAAHDDNAIAQLIATSPNIRGATAAIPVAVAVVGGATAVAAAVKAAAHFRAFPTHEYRKPFSGSYWNNGIDPPTVSPLRAGPPQERAACTACTQCNYGEPLYVGRDGERLALARVIKPLMARRSNVSRAGCGR